MAVFFKPFTLLSIQGREYLQSCMAYMCLMQNVMLSIVPITDKILWIQKAKF